MSLMIGKSTKFLLGHTTSNCSEDVFIMPGKELCLALRNMNIFYSGFPTPGCCDINRRAGTGSGLGGSGLGGVTGAIINTV